jgi:hypothetical protein
MGSFRAFGSTAALALALLASPDPARAAGPDLIDIDGNLVLVDEVYLTVVELPPDAQASARTAEEVARQILVFLRRAGYALARVEARVSGGRILVTVDEGRLSKIVVKGRDVVSSLAVRFQIVLPYDVFNRPQLERLLAGFRRDGVTVGYQLVPTREVDHIGPQVDPLTLLPGSQSQAPQGEYDLHIEFVGSSRGSRLTLVAGIDPDSIRAGGELTRFSSILDGDRAELEAQVGANYFEDLRRQADELKFSRVFGDARWIAPAIAFETLRLSLRIREDLVRRQRKDLLVERYWWNRLEGALGLAFEPWLGMNLTLELGAQQRNLFAITQLDDAAIPPVEPSSDLLGFVALTGRMVFDPERLRVDRRQRIQFDARQFMGSGRSPFWLVDAEYKRVFEFGWNDLWVRSAVGGVAGDFEIADALPMTGRYLRSVFGNQLYLDRAAALVFDYRLSLKRDIFKVGLFHEAAVFREAPGPTSDRTFSAGNSFGPSFHVLVLDVLQLDVSYAFGLLLDGSFDYGLSLRLEKAF